MNVFNFPSSDCSSCGKPTKNFIDLVDADSGANAGHKYLCDDCQPLDEDGLRLLVDKRDEEIRGLRRNLQSRDDFIVAKGLWSDFTDGLPRS